MTKLYIPVSSIEQANILKKLLWDLTITNPENVTKYYEEPLIHPLTGEVRLPINSVGFFISPTADKHLFDVFLQNFVDLGIINLQKITDIQDKIETFKGQSVNLQEMLPEVWFNALVNKQWLDDNGWFNYPEILP